MGYGKRDGSIQTFWPDDTENRIYIDGGWMASGTSLQELMERAAEKWPGISPADITISAEHIHTDCLGYDLYDPGDYTEFIILSRNS